MPYWKCPKCGSEETYQGTELVTNVKGSGGGRSGGKIGYSLSGDFDVTPTYLADGATKPITITSTTEEKTVTKCKKCDTLLSHTKDLHMAAKELEANRYAKKLRIQHAQQEKEKKEAKARTQKKEQQKFWNPRIKVFATFFIVLLLLSYILGFGSLYSLPILMLLSMPIAEIGARVLFTNKDKCDAKKTFTTKNLSTCGDAAAQLIDDNLVQIVGGTEEEQATCVKWVKENHPEYDIC